MPSTRSQSYQPGLQDSYVANTSPSSEEAQSHSNTGPGGLTSPPAQQVLVPSPMQAARQDPVGHNTDTPTAPHTAGIPLTLQLPQTWF